MTESGESSGQRERSGAELRAALDDLADITARRGVGGELTLFHDEADRLQNAIRVVTEACPNGEVVSLSEYERVLSDNQHLVDHLRSALTAFRAFRQYAIAIDPSARPAPDIEGIFGQVESLLSEHEPGSKAPD